MEAVLGRPAVAEAGVIEQARLDPAAFGSLYARHVQRVYRFVYSRVHERSLAEDITEDVFFNALKAMATYRHTETCFSAAVYLSASNAVTSHYRRARNQVDLDPIGDLPDTTESVLDTVVR